MKTTCAAMFVKYKDVQSLCLELYIFIYMLSILSMLCIVVQDSVEERLQCVGEMNTARYQRVCRGEEPLCPWAQYMPANNRSATGRRSYHHHHHQSDSVQPASNTTATCCQLQGHSHRLAFPLFLYHKFASLFDLLQTDFLALINANWEE